MIEHVISLRPRLAPVKGNRVENAAPAIEDRAGRVALRIHAAAPHCRVRVRLWDRLGRNPTDPANGQELLFTGGAPDRTLDLQLPGERDSFEGRTLTWVIRLQAADRSSYEVRLTLLQGAAEVPGGDFSYTGPLLGLEQLSGRFHFREDRG
jgi:hypothetical protein